MKRASTLRKVELLKQLNWLERKNKMNQVWDNNVKAAFEVSGSYSFEELIIKNTPEAEKLISVFSK